MQFIDDHRDALRRGRVDLQEVAARIAPSNGTSGTRPATHDPSCDVSMHRVQRAHDRLKWQHKGDSAAVSRTRNQPGSGMPRRSPRIWPQGNGGQPGRRAGRRYGAPGTVPDSRPPRCERCGLRFPRRVRGRGVGTGPASHQADRGTKIVRLTSSSRSLWRFDATVGPMHPVWMPRAGSDFTYRPLTWSGLRLRPPGVDRRRAGGALAQSIVGMPLAKIDFAPARSASSSMRLTPGGHRTIVAVHRRGRPA